MLAPHHRIYLLDLSSIWKSLYNVIGVPVMICRTWKHTLSKLPILNYCNHLFWDVLEITDGRLCKPLSFSFLMIRNSCQDCGRRYYDLAFLKTLSKQVNGSFDCAVARLITANLRSLSFTLHNHLIWLCTAETYRVMVTYTNFFESSNLLVNRW